VGVADLRNELKTLMPDVQNFTAANTLMVNATSSASIISHKIRGQRSGKLAEHGHYGLLLLLTKKSLSFTSTAMLP
jgi:hypothetical protein